MWKCQFYPIFLALWFISIWKTNHKLTLQRPQLWFSWGYFWSTPEGSLISRMDAVSLEKWVELEMCTLMGNAASAPPSCLSRGCAEWLRLCMSPSEPSQEDSGLEPMSSADAEQQTVTSASHELSGKVRTSPSVGKLQRLHLLTKCVILMVSWASPVAQSVMNLLAGSCLSRGEGWARSGHRTQPAALTLLRHLVVRLGVP